MRDVVSPCLTLAMVGAAALSLAGCGRAANAALPPEESFYLPTPAEQAQAQARAAVCASDTNAYDALVERIATYNDALDDRIALLRALQAQTARQLSRTGEVEFVVEGERGTLTLHAVEDDAGAVVYDVSAALDGAEAVTFLTGDANAERTAGTWQVLRDDAVVVDVAWSKESSEALVVDRTVHGAAGDRTSHYTNDGVTVALTFSGPNHDAEAHWDVATKDGAITIGDVTTCFDASVDAVDFCTVPCGEP